MSEKKIGPTFAAELSVAGVGQAPISWNTEDGTINYGDYTDLVTGEVRRNPNLTQAQRDTIAAVFAAHDPTQPAPAMVPEAVTRYQARAALLEAGLLSQVDSFFASLPYDDMGRLAWDEAPTVRRDSEALAAGAHALGLVDAQIDALFVCANEIQ